MGWRRVDAAQRACLPGVERNDLASRRGRDAGSLSVVREPLAPRVGCGSKRTIPIPGIGERFGELVVTGYLLGARGGVVFIVVQCSCNGPEHTVYDYNLRKGKSTRCNACAKKRGGYWRKRYTGYADILPDDVHRTRLLDRISAIIDRCRNPNSRNWTHYGGRGIGVHAPWVEDRRAFLRYLIGLDGWDNPSLDIDRADNERGYEPGNLRFVTRKANAANRREMSVLQRRVHELEARLRHCTCGAAEPVHDHNGPRPADCT